MKKDSLIFIGHILETINDIEESVKGLSKEQFEKNKDIKDSNIRRLEIIGETTKNLPKEFTKKYLNIPWKDISGMRDKIIHHYFGIDLEEIWKVIQKDLPELKKQINDILKIEKT
ncbi:MAG: DUF86 domain-containing protein [Nanoarchaeota archaeon]|nr:DUF86 domain-containing protein [Nanoarchaeota archaeon]